MDIFVLGFYDHNNIGDESYKKSFPILFPQHNFLFSNKIDQKSIDKCDVVFLGGGNVIRKHFVQELKKIKGKKIYGFSVGIEEDNQEDISFFEHVYARDSRTVDLLQNRNIPHTSMPDAAFALKPNPESGLTWIKSKFKQENLDLYKQIITVVINGYITKGNPEDFAKDSFNFLSFSYNLARIIDETPASFIFMPFGTEMPVDDRIPNSWTATKCKFCSKNLTIFDRIDYQTALNVISASNLTISSRLHSSIFSFLSGTPLIDITHHSKNDIFIKSIGKENCKVSYWGHDPNKIKELIKEQLQQPKHQEAKPFTQKLLDITNEIRFNQ